MVQDTIGRIRELAREGQIRISEHGYDEMAADGLFARDLVEGLSEGEVIEDYPEYAKGPCVLVLQKTRGNEFIHTVWGIPRGEDGPAVLVTAYRPDPAKWEDDFRRRRR